MFPTSTRLASPRCHLCTLRGGPGSFAFAATSGPTPVTLSTITPAKSPGGRCPPHEPSPPQRQARKPASPREARHSRLPVQILNHAVIRTKTLHATCVELFRYESPTHDAPAIFIFFLVFFWSHRAGQTPAPVLRQAISVPQQGL